MASSIKTIQYKITNLTELQKQFLWDKHVEFNAALREALSVIFKLHNGNKYQKDLCRIIANDTPSSDHYLNAIWNNNFKSKKAFDMKANFIGLDHKPNVNMIIMEKPCNLTTVVLRTAGAKYASYVELHNMWKKERDERWKAIEKFNNENVDYQAVINDYKEFQKTSGIIKGRSDKWINYNDFIVKNISWRKQTELVKCNVSSLKSILRYNPECEALHQLLGVYRRINRTSRPPTYTQPHHDKHPGWMSWYGVANPKYTIKHEQLVEFVFDNIPFNVQCMPNKRVETLDDKYIIDDIPGYTNGQAQLIWKNHKPYISVTYKKKLVQVKTGIVCGVDLGLTTTAVVSLTDGNKLFGSKFITINSLTRHINKHCIAISKEQRKYTKTTGNRLPKKFRAKLHKHIKEMCIDFARKLANKIVCAARTCYKIPADTIVMEMLGTMIPNNSNSKFFNKKLARMVHGKVRYFVKAIAASHNIVYREILPAGTSQVCSKCRNFGIRFNPRSGKIYSCARIFVCSECGNKINADLNASFNIANVFLNKRHLDNFFAMTSSERSDRRKLLKCDEKIISSIDEYCGKRKRLHSVEPAVV